MPKSQDTLEELSAAQSGDITRYQPSGTNHSDSRMATSQNVSAELTQAQVMTDEKSTFMSDGLAEAGVTMADMERGNTIETIHDEGRVDADGTNYVGDPYARVGFMEPNSKYQRL